MNVLSQFWTLQAFLPRMVELDRGHVLCMSSTAGVTGTPFLTAYCASKHANKGMMEALLMEHRQERPRCRVGMTTVHPFTVRRKHFFSEENCLVMTLNFFTIQKPEKKIVFLPLYFL